MVNFIVRGKHSHVSKEELRCMLQSAATVLEFHNMKPKMLVLGNVITVSITKSKKRLGKTKDGKQAVGVASRNKPNILLADWQSFSSCFTTVVHEVIHIYEDFPSEMCEKLTSTLTAKLKPAIAGIYNSLIEGVYQRAAYIAHTKISYRPKGKDFYDDNQWNPVVLSNAGKKYRKVDVKQV